MNKPLVGVLVGLLISIVVVLFVSTILAFLFYMVINRADDYSLYEDLTYLVLDLSLATLLFYFSGKVLSKYTLDYEYKYGVTLTVLTLIAYLVLSIQFDSFKTYPSWYMVISFIIIPVGILLGVKNRK